uniref:NADH-ubiquinone oxidoreductase chain N n=1 Tax=Parastrongyloides trichosuri TaxID=131310 RepID=A0A0N4Z3T4_PARTI
RLRRGLARAELLRRAVQRADFRPGAGQVALGHPPAPALRLPVWDPGRLCQPEPAQRTDRHAGGGRVGLALRPARGGRRRAAGRADRHRSGPYGRSGRRRLAARREPPDDHSRRTAGTGHRPPAGRDLLHLHHDLGRPSRLHRAGRCGHRHPERRALAPDRRLGRADGPAGGPLRHPGSAVQPGRQGSLPALRPAAVHALLVPAQSDSPHRGRRLRLHRLSPAVAAVAGHAAGLRRHVDPCGGLLAAADASGRSGADDGGGRGAGLRLLLPEPVLLGHGLGRSGAPGHRRLAAAHIDGSRRLYLADLYRRRLIGRFPPGRPAPSAVDRRGVGHRRAPLIPGLRLGRTGPDGACPRSGPCADRAPDHDRGRPRRRRPDARRRFRGRRFRSASGRRHLGPRLGRGSEPRGHGLGRRRTDGAGRVGRPRPADRAGFRPQGGRRRRPGHAPIQRLQPDGRHRRAPLRDGQRAEQRHLHPLPDLHRGRRGQDAQRVHPGVQGGPERRAARDPVSRRGVPAGRGADLLSAGLLASRSDRGSRVGFPGALGRLSGGTRGLAGDSLSACHLAL